MNKQFKFKERLDEMRAKIEKFLNEKNKNAETVNEDVNKETAEKNDLEKENETPEE